MDFTGITGTGTPGTVTIPANQYWYPYVYHQQCNCNCRETVEALERVITKLIDKLTELEKKK